LTGRKNIAIGEQAGFTNVNAKNNLAIGYQACYANNSGEWNMAIGSNALYNTTTGYNVAIGGASLYTNTSGDLNLAIGQSSMYSNTIGSRNVAIGTATLIANTTGNYNTGVGQYNLMAAKASNNTAVGYQAGLNTNLGGNHTFIGYLAGSRTSDNSGNTCIGYQAGTGNTSDYGNIVCLGANTIATGKDQVILGSVNMNVYGGTYNTISDRRDKEEIATMGSDYGLNFIKQLRPVNFKYDYRAEYYEPLPSKTEEETDADFNTRLDNWSKTNNLKLITKDGSKKHIRIHHGFIAQEVGDLNMFGGFQNHTINGGDDLCTLNYNEFIAPLVKSVQELSNENTTLKQQIADLTTQYTELAEIVNKLNS